MLGFEGATGSGGGLVLGVEGATGSGGDSGDSGDGVGDCDPLLVFLW